MAALGGLREPRKADQKPGWVKTVKFESEVKLGKKLNWIRPVETNVAVSNTKERAAAKMIGRWWMDFLIMGRK